jgi:hypothetical protein
MVVLHAQLAKPSVMGGGECYAQPMPRSVHHTSSCQCVKVEDGCEHHMAKMLQQHSIKTLATCGPSPTCKL